MVIRAQKNFLVYTKKFLVRLKGFEPLALALEVRCSIQLSYKRILSLMERVMGIEPTQSAWKAEVLPLNYTRIFSSKACHQCISSSSALLTLSIIHTLLIFVNTFYEFFNDKCLNIVYINIDDVGLLQA